MKLYESLSYKHSKKIASYKNQLLCQPVFLWRTFEYLTQIAQ